MHRSLLRAFFVSGPCALALVLGAGPALADSTLTFDGTAKEGGLDHEFIDFDVPAGTVEIQVDHENVSKKGVLDWGLNDPSGFRGWGGGNKEPAVVGELAASRSYLPGPIAAGKWRVVVGKAQIKDGAADYHVVVTLRDKATLAPQPERKPYVESPPLSTEGRYYAGDFHAHSRESGDAQPTIDDLVTFARSQGLDFVELSDHNTVSQLDFIDAAQKGHADVLIVPGVEFTTYAGHANGIGATKWVDHKIGQPGVDIAGAAASFRAQGALFSINHPLFQLGDLCIGCGWKHDLPAEDVDAVEIATSGTGALFADGTLAFWDKLCDTGRHVAAVGGSDDHSAGQKEGSFSTPVGTPATYVFAKDLSVPSLLEGIRNSRTVVKLDGPKGPMIELTSNIAVEADTIHAEQATLHAKITGASGLDLSWIKNGEATKGSEIAEDPFEMDLPIEAPTTGQDRYRVEVYREGKPATITSHVWVEFKAGVGVPKTDPLPMSAPSACGCKLEATPLAKESWASSVALACGLLAAFRRRSRRRDRQGL